MSDREKRNISDTVKILMQLDKHSQRDEQLQEA